MTHSEIRKGIGIGVGRNAPGDGFSVCDILMDLYEWALCREIEHGEDYGGLLRAIGRKLPRRLKQHPKLIDWVDRNIDTEANVFDSEDEAWSAIESLL